jgi:hypothetical protein
MTRFVRTFRAAMLLLAVMWPAAARGQIVPRSGELVQAHIRDSLSEFAGERCLAQLTASARDTLLLAAQGTCPRGSYLADVRVARGDRGSRATHVAIGALLGAAAGAVLARSLIDDDCTPTCGDAGGGDIRTVLGATTGAMIGTLAGLAFPAGTRWVDAGRGRPIRVGQLALRPDVRVSLSTR